MEIGRQYAQGSITRFRVKSVSMSGRAAYGVTEGGWDTEGIRRLRETLGDTQQAFAERLGTRQQTVSEWERGTSRPGRMARRLLHLVAEQHGVYDASARIPEADRGDER